MKKNQLKKNSMIRIFAPLLIIAMLLINPYNLFHYFNAESKVLTLLADPTVKMEMLNDDTEIIKVTYRGSNLYQVETKKNTYVLKIKKNKSGYDIDVFEHTSSVKKFDY